MDCATRKLKPRSVALAFFNANGLHRQRDLVKDFCQTHQVDVMLVQETLLKPSKSDPRIANYAVVRNDRTTNAGGGTLIYYRRSLHCVSIDTPPLTNIEASCCRLAMNGHQPIILASCYLPPDKLLLSSDVNALLSLGSSVILAGDFNCKNTSWNCNTTNNNGRILDNLTDAPPDLDFDHFDIIAPLEPTRFPGNPNHRPEILDIALLKGVALRLSSITVLHELDSDHRPVLMRLGPDPTTDLTPTKTIVDWKRLGASLQAANSPDLDKIPDHIQTSEDVTLAIDALTSHLRTVIGDSSKQVPAVDDRWALPEDVRRMMNAKNAATRAYDSAPSRENKANLNYWQRTVKKRISELRAQNWTDTLSGLEPTHQAYWKLARKLKTDTLRTIPPLDRPNQPPAFDDEEKAECLAESLESQCSLSPDFADPTHLRAVVSEVERRSSLAPPDPPLEPVTVAEVESAIKKLPIRKAPGADGISNRMLKLFSPHLVFLLVSIFNAAMSNCSFPDAWKSADVIGIHKPGKKASEPSSYRPISLLSTLGKVYERLILRRLWAHVHEHKLLPDEQFGFRARHSCVQQVHRITEHVLEGFNAKPKPKGTLAVFLDVAKAFDKVWHDGLIYKLYHIGMPDRLVRIIQDFLRDRSFRYRIEGERSSPHPIRAGVPQGSALSPLLFSLYTSDIPRSFHPSVQFALFADDTAIYCSGWNRSHIRSRLQKALTDIGAWFRRWRISVNPDKSAAMYFSDYKRGPPARPLTLFDRPIPWVKSTKYLGVTLDDRLTFGDHVRRVRNKAAFVLGRLHPLLCKNSKMSLRNKVTLYKTCIRPIMTYASVAFAHASPLHTSSLQVLQNRFIRKAVGARWFQRNTDLHCDLELPSILQFMKDASRRFFDAAPHHPNPLVVEASNYSTDTTDVAPRRRRPRNFLDDPDDPIAVATAAALGSPNPSSPSGLGTVFGTGIGYQRNTITHRPRRRGRRSPRSLASTAATFNRVHSSSGRSLSDPLLPATAQAEARTLRVPLS